MTSRHFVCYSYTAFALHVNIFSLFVPQVLFTETPKFFSSRHHWANGVRSQCCQWQPHHTGRRTFHLESPAAQKAPAKVVWPTAWPKRQSAAGSAGSAAWVKRSSSCQRWQWKGPRSPDEGGVCPGHLSGSEPQPPSLSADWTEWEGRLLPH